MELIEIGDLTLDSTKSSKQSGLFHAIREKIVSGLWVTGGQLPSTRKLAETISVSRNTVIAAYEQLVDEGYIQSRVGSGYFVCLDIPDQYLGDATSFVEEELIPTKSDPNGSFAPGVADLETFPFGHWQKLLQRHTPRKYLAGNQILQGLPELRLALASYLSSSRSVACQSKNIIITSGAQQALTIALLATQASSKQVLIEEPGYAQMRKVADMLGQQQVPIPVVPYHGIDAEQILSYQSATLYITPSNQYPMGTTIDTEQRIELVKWAERTNSWVIEDDYDSEFQFSHRPFTSLQGLAAQLQRSSKVLYVGSLSKVMFNSLRLGYLVVPDDLVEKCLKIKDALSGDTPAHTQAALSYFISEGGLVRHIRKMRKRYKIKYEAITSAIERSFDGQMEVMSQAAGLHITLRWKGGICEQEWVNRAAKEGIVIRPLSFYEHAEASRAWNSVVLGFGNTLICSSQTGQRIKRHIVFQS